MSEERAEVQAETRDLAEASGVKLLHMVNIELDRLGNYTPTERARALKDLAYAYGAATHLLARLGVLADGQEGTGATQQGDEGEYRP